MGESTQDDAMLGKNTSCIGIAPPPDALARTDHKEGRTTRPYRLPSEQRDSERLREEGRYT